MPKDHLNPDTLSPIQNPTIMDVLAQIVKESPVGPAAGWFRALVITLFAGIVLILAGMLVALFLQGSSVPIRFGY